MIYIKHFRLNIEQHKPKKPWVNSVAGGRLSFPVPLKHPSCYTRSSY